MLPVTGMRPAARDVCPEKRDAYADFHLVRVIGRTTYRFEANDVSYKLVRGPDLVRESIATRDFAEDKEKDARKCFNGMALRASRSSRGALSHRQRCLPLAKRVATRSLS